MRGFALALTTLAPVAITLIAGLALQHRLAGGGGEAEEAALLAASGGLASRNGPTLDLRLAGGAVLALTDRRRCGDLPCPAPLATRYRFRGWDAQAGGYRR